MKWDCDKKHRDKFARQLKSFEESKQWHKVFAWWPTRVASGDCRWLEYVERRNRNKTTDTIDIYFLFTYCAPATIWSWEYRAIK